jgi:hypothetical protein
MRHQHFEISSLASDQAEFKLCLLVYISPSTGASSCLFLKDLIKTTASEPGQVSNRYASNNDLVIQRTRLKFGQRAFSVAALKDGCVPKDWKEANVCPIFKKGSRRQPGNYRPVSLTSQICKLCLY